MATQQQFLDMLSDIEPASTTVAACSSAHNTLREALRKDKNFSAVHVDTFLSGSYKRDTAIRPQKIDGELQRPDVDIIVETSHTKDAPPKDVLDLLKQALTDAGYENLKVNRRSIAVTLTGVDMDVVPVIANGDAFLIPDIELKTWLDTNPPLHTQWTIDKNTAADGRFKPLVKLFKWWRRQNLSDLRRPKGFILECLIAKHMNYTEKNYETLFVEVLEAINNSYVGYAIIGSVPFIEDPAVKGNNVFSNVTAEEFKKFHTKVAEHAVLARAAKNETNADAALEKWRKVLGSRFPAAAVNKAASSSTLQPALGIGLTFPDKPLVPPNKPAGFA